MISNFIKVGMKLDIMVEPTGNEEKDNAREMYTSQIQNVFTNGDIEIAMPIYQRKLILLNNSIRYQLIFFTGKSYYSAIGSVVERYKSDNQYFARIELKTQLERFQRREFFRCECIIDILYNEIPTQELNAEPLNDLIERYEKIDMHNEMTEGVALDISGGGIRFVSRQKNEVGSVVRLVFELPVHDEMKTFQAVGTILSCELQKDSKLKYECRLKFVYIKSADREDIVRYIFERERQLRKLSRG